MVNGLEQEFSGQPQVMRLDADDPENEQLMQDLNLHSHPSFAVIDAQGHITARFFGPQSVETLREAMHNVLE